MEGLLHQIVSGIATGGIYASLALALSMIYQSTHLVNFAQGEMAMLTTYIAWTSLNCGLPYYQSILLSITSGFLIGLMTERIIIRKLDRQSPLSIVVVFIGLLVFFNGFAGWIWTHTIRAFPSPFVKVLKLDNSLISIHEIGVVVTTLMVLGCVYLIMYKTSLGMAMRASALNPTSSQLVGINVNMTTGLGWGISAMVGSFSGIMIAPVLFLEPNMMFGVLLYGFAGALLGGIANPWGSVVGGFIIGILDNIIGGYLIGSELKLTVALIIIISILLLKPIGLFGKKSIARV